MFKCFPLLIFYIIPRCSFANSFMLVYFDWFNPISLATSATALQSPYVIDLPEQFPSIHVFRLPETNVLCLNYGSENCSGWNFQSSLRLAVSLKARHMCLNPNLNWDWIYWIWKIKFMHFWVSFYACKMNDKEIKMIIGLKIKVQISCFVLVQISYLFWSKFHNEFFKHTGLPCNFLNKLVKYINNLWVLHIDLFFFLW